MNLEEKRRVLDEIDMRRNGGNSDKLQAVLDGLWKTADGSSRVDRAVFDLSLTRLRPYFWKLERAGCIRLTIGGERNNAILGISLLQKKVPPQKDECKQTPTPVTMAPKVSEEPLPPHCLVFMDMPNLLRFVENGCEPLRFLSLWRSDWNAFRDTVSQITAVPRENQTCFAFFKLPHKNGAVFEEYVCGFTRNYGIRTAIRRKKEKDVDCMMDPVVVSETLKQFLSKGREVKIVMVSGDSDRSFALLEVRNWARKLGIRLTIYVLAWKDALSQSDKCGELQHVADEIHLVETYLRDLDPRGYELYIHHQQEVLRKVA